LGGQGENGGSIPPTRSDPPVGGEEPL
jgi:hypothetical protein